MCICQAQNQIQHCGLTSQNRNDFTVGNGQINVFQYGYTVIRLLMFFSSNIFYLSFYSFLIAIH